MIRLYEIKIHINDILDGAGSFEELLKKAAARRLKVPEENILKLKLIRKAVDRRDNQDILYVCTLDTKLSYEKGGSLVSDEKEYIKNFHIKKAKLATTRSIHIPKLPDTKRKNIARPVVVGTGPAGLFAAYVFAEAGLCPILLERGEEAQKRLKSVASFHAGGALDPDSNVQFGEGGAGTFSDGKLYSGIRDREGFADYILRTFVRFGAPESILTSSEPHIGSDGLLHILGRMRAYIVNLGGEYRFNARFSGYEEKDGQIQAISYLDLTKGSIESIDTNCLVLAIGHSARDTIEYLCGRGIQMEPKAFAVGFRVMHPQINIDRALYGTDRLNEKRFLLGPSSYRLSQSLSSGRNVYSFCMCPGGFVIDSSSEKHALSVNGMSYSWRGSQAANAAIVVGVTPGDYPGGSLAGMYWQRELEKRTYSLGGGSIPYETFHEFREGITYPHGQTNYEPRLKGRGEAADLRGIFPSFINEAIKEGMEAFGRKIEGFDGEEALLFGSETRTSAPYRILRDKTRSSCSLGGLYPVGEGAGYSGGIISSARDGLCTAFDIIGNNMI